MPKAHNPLKNLAIHSAISHISCVVQLSRYQQEHLVNTYSDTLANIALMLDHNQVPQDKRYDYRKQARFYLDFCDKYH